jgi:hypothetical protein
VKRLGRDDDVFSDHTDVRPTLLTLLGLKDDYVHDGRVLVEMINPNALPGSLARQQFQYAALASFYKQINAPLGAVGMNSLVASNAAITGSDAGYQAYLSAIGPFTASRDALAGEIKLALDRAAFSSGGPDDHHFDDMGHRARGLIGWMGERARDGHHHW